MALPLVVPALLEIGGKLIDKLIPDPEAKAKAQLDLLVLNQKGELDELQIRMSAILAEANSEDPWTSRARPSFLYVVYIVILTGIPMGLIHALNPPLAVSISEGFQTWLAAIPEEMWWLFGVGYTGYAAARTLDKRRK